MSAAAVPTGSTLTDLECPRCEMRHDAFRLQNLCACGSPLLARYDLDAARERVGPDLLAQRPQTLWRYAELLPLQDERFAVSLGEPVTPLLSLPRLAAGMDVGTLLVKDESRLPTGTFKARGAAVGVSRALELGVRHVAMPTNGNAGAAWAAYAARAGMAMTVTVPAGAPDIPVREMLVTGARTHLVDGHIGDAGRTVAAGAARHGWFDASTLREPYRLEGKKTLGLEIVEQLGWSVPDVIVYPTGGGVGLVGIAKAVQECQALGWLDARLPRLVAAQATGCAPVVRAWERGADTVEPWPDPHTVAFGITVPRPLGDRLILDALRRSGGCGVAVDDADALEELRRTAQEEGLFLCPEGAVTVAAARRLRREGWIRAGERVVLINTGAGTLYPECVTERAHHLGAGEAL